MLSEACPGEPASNHLKLSRNGWRAAALNVSLERKQIVTIFARNMDKRVRRLETYHGDPPFLILLCDKGESSEARVARWEAENGSLVGRQPIVVGFVSAQIDRAI